MTTTMIQAMLQQKAELTPEVGYRVVGLDDFELPGAQLFPISDHATKVEAEAALEQWKKAHPGEEAWVYGSP